LFCPYCASNDTKVVDKRDLEDTNASRRRRECLKCNKRFTTYERIENVDLRVVKKDGSQEKYDREKFKRGISLAAQKLTPEEVEEMVDAIEMRLLNRKSTEVSTGDIGRMVLTRLKHKDPIGYMRFASVFIGFKDLDEFKRELDKIRSK